MVKLKPGDRVKCRVHSGLIVAPYGEEYEKTVIFEIIASDDYGYCLYVPHYLYLKNCVILDKKKVIDWKVNYKFIDEKCIYIRESLVCQVESVMDGCSCDRCGEFLDKASPEEDGTMVCWSCRAYPFYR